MIEDDSGFQVNKWEVVETWKDEKQPMDQGAHINLKVKSQV